MTNELETEAIYELSEKIDMLCGLLVDVDNWFPIVLQYLFVNNLLLGAAVFLLARHFWKKRYKKHKEE